MNYDTEIVKQKYYKIYIITSKRMEKLIKLLNDYENWKRGERTLWVYTGGMLYYIQSCDRYLDLKIISNKYGFIKRLVDSDKININEGWNDYEKTNLYCNSDFFQLQQHYSYYESLLMLLAIQDKPIDFLISILK